jgi:hypothetical protein
VAKFVEDERRSADSLFAGRRFPLRLRGRLLFKKRARVGKTEEVF